MSKSNAFYMDQLSEAHTTIDELIHVLETVELLARVNAPITDGSPMYKSIVAVLEKVNS